MTRCGCCCRGEYQPPKQETSASTASSALEEPKLPKPPKLPKRCNVVAISCKGMQLSYLPNDTARAAVSRLRTSEYNPLAQFEQSNPQAALLNDIWTPNLRPGSTPAAPPAKPAKRNAEAIDATTTTAKRQKRITE